MSSQRRYAAAVVLLVSALFLTGCPDVAESSDNEAPNAPATVSVTGVILTPDSKNLVVGTSVGLTAAVTPSNASDKNLSWVSDHEDIASVDVNGIVTAKKVGNATITVTTAEGGYNDSSSITVTAASVAVTGITLSPESVHPYKRWDLSAVRFYIPVRCHKRRGHLVDIRFLCRNSFKYRSGYGRFRGKR